MVHSQTERFIDVISSCNTLASEIRRFETEDHTMQVTLSSHMIAYPSSSTRGSRDDMSKMLTSFMNGISNAFETNPGTSLDTVTSLSHATANARARDNVSSDVCNAEISSTNFCRCAFSPPLSSWACR
jgi:hypothetical protein